MYAEYGLNNSYIASLYYAEPQQTEDGDTAGAFVLSFHHGEMPAFDSKDFSTLTEAKVWAKANLGITHWRDYDGKFTAAPD